MAVAPLPCSPTLHGYAGTPSLDKSMLVVPLCFEIRPGNTSLHHQGGRGLGTPFLACCVFVNCELRKHTPSPHPLQGQSASTSINLLPCGDNVYLGAPFINSALGLLQDEWLPKEAQELGCERKGAWGVEPRHGKTATAIRSLKFIH